MGRHCDDTMVPQDNLDFPRAFSWMLYAPIRGLEFADKIYKIILNRMALILWCESTTDIEYFVYRIVGAVNCVWICKIS